MKKKVGTVLDEDLVLEAKRRALSEKRSLNHLFEDALRRYLEHFAKKDSVSKNSRGSMRVPVDTLKQIMDEETFYGSE